MDINSLIDGGGPAAHNSSSATSSPVAPSRRQTVSSLLNDDDESVSPMQTRRSSQASPKSPISPLQTRRKPKRYATPPIWAQRWQGKRHTHHVNEDSAPNGKQSHSKSYVSVSGLPTSITGILPYEDLTRKVTEWIYANLVNIPKEHLQYLEVEIKFGTIKSKANEQRIDIGALSETLLRPDWARQKTAFQSRMKDELFGRAMSFMDKRSETPSGDVKALQKISTKTRDCIFSSRTAAHSLRVTYNEQNQEIARIVKKRVGDLMVHSPGDLMDLRISINLEMPPAQEDGVSEAGRPMVRHKNRTSYAHDGMQFDLTAVITGSEATHANKELEVELDKDALVGYLESFQQGDQSAMEKFEELIRLGMDNSRIINREVSRDY